MHRQKIRADATAMTAETGGFRQSLEMHEQTRTSFFIEMYCLVNAFLVDDKQNKKKKNP